MNVDLHIDRLVLDGLELTPRQGEAVRASIQLELARLLTEQGLPTPVHGRTQAHVQAPSIDLAVGVPAPEVGFQVARAIHEGLTR